jgi:transposase InsO family protein
MITKLSRPRLCVDRAKVAAFFGVTQSSLIELPLSSSPGMFIFRYICQHPRRPLSPTNLFIEPDCVVYLHLMMDEDNVCYGMGAMAPCGRVYFVEPTIELLEFMEKEAQRNTKQQLKN